MVQSKLALYPDDIKCEISRIVNQTAVGPLTILTEIIEYLQNKRIGYKMILHTDLLLVHPENRGRLGINAHNSHRNLATIVKIGGDRSLLTMSIAFEMSPDIAEKAEQIAFNQRLIDGSKGMLASIKGGERFLSVGASHTVGWCRSANSGCKTNEKTIMVIDGPIDGCIDVDRIKKDAEIRFMLEEGWEWFIIPWQVAKEWPMLTHILQKACNSHNTVPCTSTELEVACSIAEYAELEQSQVDNGAKKEVDWESCLQAAVAGNPPCMNYAQQLLMLVRDYGGGVGAPRVQALDSLAKMFNENKMIGEEVLTSIVNLKLPQSCTRFRHGLLVCNLTSTKVVDGIARCISKADVGGLKGKEAMVMDVEDTYFVMHNNWFAEHSTKIMVMPFLNMEVQLVNVHRPSHTFTSIVSTSKMFSDIFHADVIETMVALMPTIVKQTKTSFVYSGGC